MATVAHGTARRPASAGLNVVGRVWGWRWTGTVVTIAHDTDRATVPAEPWGCNPAG